MLPPTHYCQLRPRPLHPLVATETASTGLGTVITHQSVWQPMGTTPEPTSSLSPWRPMSTSPAPGSPRPLEQPMSILTCPRKLPVTQATLPGHLLPPAHVALPPARGLGWKQMTKGEEFDLPVINVHTSVGPSSAISRVGHLCLLSPSKQSKYHLLDDEKKMALEQGGGDDSPFLVSDFHARLM